MVYVRERETCGSRGTNGLATHVPLREGRHGVRRVFLQEGDETVQIKPFPSA
jgi:hypothetical protein